VVKNGEIIKAQGYGVADDDRKMPAQTDTGRPHTARGITGRIPIGVARRRAARFLLTIRPLPR